MKQIGSVIFIIILILFLYNLWKPSIKTKDVVYESKIEQFTSFEEPVIEEFTLSGLDSSSDEVKEIVDILTENTENKALTLGYDIKISSKQRKILIDLMEKDKEYLLEQWIKSYKHLTVNLIALDTAQLINEALNTK